MGFYLGGLFMGFLPQKIVAASALTHVVANFLKSALYCFV